MQGGELLGARGGTRQQRKKSADECRNAAQPRRAGRRAWRPIAGSKARRHAARRGGAHARRGSHGGTATAAAQVAQGRRRVGSSGRAVYVRMRLGKKGSYVHSNIGNGQRGRQWPVTSGHLGSSGVGGPHSRAAGGRGKAGRSSLRRLGGWVGGGGGSHGQAGCQGRQAAQPAGHHQNWGGGGDGTHICTRAETWAGRSTPGEQSTGVGWRGSRGKQGKCCDQMALCYSHGAAQTCGTAAGGTPAGVHARTAAPSAAAAGWGRGGASRGLGKAGARLGVGSR